MNEKVREGVKKYGLGALVAALSLGVAGYSMTHSGEKAGVKASDASVKAVAASEALAHAGEAKEAVTEFVVAGGITTKNRTLLNSEKDFKSPGCLTVVVPAGIPIGDAKSLVGKKVRAVGTVTTYTHPTAGYTSKQIVISSADKIAVQ